MAVFKQRPRVAVICLLFYFLNGGLSRPDPRQREALIQLETSMQMGGQIVLTDAEQRLHSVLMKYKQEELGRVDFPPSMHFFKAKSLIRTSPIFSVLQKMPKGGFNLVLPDFKPYPEPIRVFITNTILSNAYSKHRNINLSNVMMGVCILRTPFTCYTI